MFNEMQPNSSPSLSNHAYKKHQLCLSQIFCSISLGLYFTRFCY